MNIRYLFCGARVAPAGSHAVSSSVARNLSMGLKENLDRIQELSRQAELGGGEERLKRQRSNGRMTARERIEFLLDRGSFVELDKFKTHRITDFDIQKIPGDGVSPVTAPSTAAVSASSRRTSRSSAAVC